MNFFYFKLSLTKHYLNQFKRWCERGLITLAPKKDASFFRLLSSGDSVRDPCRYVDSEILLLGFDYFLEFIP